MQCTKEVWSQPGTGYKDKIWRTKLEGKFAPLNSEENLHEKKRKRRFLKKTLTMREVRNIKSLCRDHNHIDENACGIWVIIAQAYFFTDNPAITETGISETSSLGKNFLSLAEKILEFSQKSLSFIYLL